MTPTVLSSFPSIKGCKCVQSGRAFPGRPGCLGSPSRANLDQYLTVVWKEGSPIHPLPPSIHPFTFHLGIWHLASSLSSSSSSSPLMMTIQSQVHKLSYPLSLCTVVHSWIRPEKFLRQHANPEDLQMQRCRDPPTSSSVLCSLVSSPLSSLLHLITSPTHQYYPLLMCSSIQRFADRPILHLPLTGQQGHWQRHRPAG